MQLKFETYDLIVVGIRHEVRDDIRSNVTTSSSLPSGDLRSIEQEGATMPAGEIVMSTSRVVTGASEVLALLRTLGEAYRLSCLYRSQVLHSEC